MPIGPRLMKHPDGKPAPKPKTGPLPPYKVEHRIGIQAPAEVIWEILSDFETWREWNPTHPAAMGQLAIGGPFHVAVALPGRDTFDYKTKFIDWMPEEQMLWTGYAWRGWAKSVRYLELEHLNAAACIFSNGELFDGVIAEIYGHRHRRALRAAFGALGEALKERAEALWNERSGGAT